MANRSIFQEPSEDDYADSAVAWLGGMGQGVYTNWSIAGIFKSAGDILVKQVISGKSEAYQLVYPILYSYRHSLELYLKFFTKSEDNTHSLHELLNRFQTYLKDFHGIEVPEMYKFFVMEFHDFDERSTMFRYPVIVGSHSTREVGEFSINVAELKKKMTALENSFYKIREADPKLDDFWYEAFHRQWEEWKTPKPKRGTIEELELRLDRITRTKWRNIQEALQELDTGDFPAEFKAKWCAIYRQKIIELQKYVSSET